MTPIIVLFAVLVLFTAVAAYTDLSTGLISNRLIALGLLLALPLQLAVHFTVLRPPGDSAGSVLASALAYYGGGVVVCALAPLVLFRLNAMGGGDVKLLAMVGAFVGPTIGIEIELYAFVLTALFAGARLAYQGQLLKVLANSALLVTNPLRSKDRRRELPGELLTSLRFAPAVLVSTLLLTGLRVGLLQLQLGLS